MDDHGENQFQSPRRGDHVTLQDTEKVPVWDTLLIKFKNRKAGGGKHSGEGSIGNQVPGMQPRICEICKKGFSSGKALGGHVRVHLQANKVCLPKKIRNLNHKIHGPMSEGKPTCFLCSKDFLSMKSLCGHMRCHPDREWRGIQPPPPPLPKSSSCSTLSDDAAPKLNDQIDSTMTTMGSDTDLSKSQSSWSLTGKRGRKSTAASSTSSSEEQIYSAASVLMMLSQRNSHNSLEYEAKKNNFLSNNAEIEDKNQLSVKRCKKRRMAPESANMDCECKDTKWPREEKKKNIVEGPLTPDRYECSNCKRSFPSHQALGGHRSRCQNKDKKSQSMDESEVHENEECEESGSKPTHQCKICNETFLTGQALGGHKRRHLRGPIDAPLSEEASPGETSETGPKVSDFNLNELPIMDDEEGVDSAFSQV